MVGVVKEHMRKVFRAARLGAAMYVTNGVKHSVTASIWAQPSFGEVVTATTPCPRKIKEN
eukprot:12889144-Prorocentrum_lima.AAC.1